MIQQKIETPKMKDKVILLGPAILDKLPGKSESSAASVEDKRSNENDTMTMMQSIRVYEEQLLKKEDELQSVLGKIEEIKSESMRMQNIFDEKLTEIIEERDAVRSELQIKEALFD